MSIQLRNRGFDHVEFIVRSPDFLVEKYKKFGFEVIGKRVNSVEKTETIVLAQGWIRVLITTPKATDSQGRAFEFLKLHDEGITALALEVEDATKTFYDLIDRGAKPSLAPQEFVHDSGRVVRAEIFTPGHMRYVLMERQVKGDESKPAPLDLDLVVDRLKSPAPLGFLVIDHLTNNVDIGRGGVWKKWYEDVFGFKSTRFFEIHTGRTGLRSDVMESPCRRVKVPINEATEPESQVQEFVKRLKGEGCQHLAFLTNNIENAVDVLKKNGIHFLSVPSTYYDAVPQRVPTHREDLERLKELEILIDGEGEGYLLQNFTQEILGPFFLEVIQRKGNEGFGEGNFRALFEAIERDQVRRGVL